MKSIIIVTASTGAGHNQAAHNLKKQFEAQGIYCHILDMFKATNKGMNILIADGYELLAEKMPKTYGFFYKLSDQKMMNKFMFNNVFMATEYRIKWLVRELQPDLIISTHPFGAPIIGKLKKKGKIDVPFMQIVTDFKAHYTYVHAGVDAYIVASEYTEQSLIDKGANKSKIYAYGIPAKEEFWQSKERTFSSDRPLHLLIMGGSMGLAAMQDAIDILLSTDKKLKMSIVCANNKELYQKFEYRYERAIENKKVDLYGFVNNIDELMDDADLIISKPGGLTTTEAIHKCIPMIIPFAIPGQEQENTNFLVENDMAIEVKDINSLNEHINRLIEDESYYQLMVENMLNLSKTYSVDAIISLAVSLMEN